MTTQIDYGAIARENGMHPDKLYAPLAKAHGYSVKESEVVRGKYIYYGNEYRLLYRKDYYNTQEEAYKACCVENNLVEGE